MSSRTPLRVIFVCTGNICRSPMAEVVFRDLVRRQGLASEVVASSASTGDWHVGEPADQRTVDALARSGYDGSGHRAKQFTAASFTENDIVIALDRSHERILRHWARTEEDEGKVMLLLSFDAETEELDVPDPYYADTEAFDVVLGMIERASRRLFHQLEPAVRSRLHSA